MLVGWVIVWRRTWAMPFSHRPQVFPSFSSLFCRVAWLSFSSSAWAAHLVCPG